MRWTTEKTKPSISILGEYNTSWKPRCNHFLRYSDVRPKGERLFKWNKTTRRGVIGIKVCLLSQENFIFMTLTWWLEYQKKIEYSDKTNVPENIFRAVKRFCQFRKKIFFSDDRRPTVNELANQRGILQKSSGWKLFHMAAQLEDLVCFILFIYMNDLLNWCAHECVSCHALVCTIVLCLITSQLRLKSDIVKKLEYQAHPTVNSFPLQRLHHLCWVFLPWLEHIAGQRKSSTAWFIPAFYLDRWRMNKRRTRKLQKSRPAWLLVLELDRCLIQTLTSFRN